MRETLLSSPHQRDCQGDVSKIREVFARPLCCADHAASSGNWSSVPPVCASQEALTTTKYRQIEDKEEVDATSEEDAGTHTHGMTQRLFVVPHSAPA